MNKAWSRFQIWLYNSKLGRICSVTGAFVLCYITIGLMAVVALLAAGINPTLVISIVSAPLWIAVLFVSYQFARLWNSSLRESTLTFGKKPFRFGVAS